MGLYKSKGDALVATIRLCNPAGALERPRPSTWMRARAVDSLNNIAELMRLPMKVRKRTRRVWSSATYCPWKKWRTKHFPDEAQPDLLLVEQGRCLKLYAPILHARVRVS
jgi:hypothetical protein